MTMVSLSGMSVKRESKSGFPIKNHNLDQQLPQLNQMSFYCILFTA